MDIQKIIKYWVKGSQEDFITAKSLFRSKRYPHCLFFCHLFIEKILKALVTKKTQKPAPYGHNLLKLAELSGLDFSERQLNLLDEMTAFNIEARYNDYKFQFYKKATKEYTQKYFQKAKKLHLWLKKQL